MKAWKYLFKIEYHFPFLKKTTTHFSFNYSKLSVFKYLYEHSLVPLLRLNSDNHANFEPA